MTLLHSIFSEARRTFPLWAAVVVVSLEVALPGAFKSVPAYVCILVLVAWASWMSERSSSGIAALDPLRRSAKTIAYVLVGGVVIYGLRWLLHCQLLNACV